MRAEFDRVQAQATAAFGEGRWPSCKRSLIDKEEEVDASRESHPPVAAAVVYTAENASEERRHYTVVADKPVEFPAWEAAVDDMLTEGTRRCGSKCAHHFSFHWGPIETYSPIR